MGELKEMILRHLKNRRREVEEHDLLRRFPKHSRGLLKPILEELVRKEQVSKRISGNRKLYKLK